MTKRTQLTSTVALAALVAAGVTLAAGPAQAALTLSFNDGGTGTTVNVTDDGAGDGNLNPGIITFNGTVGDYTINVFTTDSTNTDSDGNPNTRDLFDLNFTATTSGAAGVLTITSLEDNYSLGSTGNAVVKTDITPTAVQDDLDFDTLYNGSTVISQNNLLPSSAGTGTANVALTDPFSLGHVAQIEHSAGASTSYDVITTVRQVPVPATLGLLGLGLVGLGAAMRRQRI